MIDLNLDRCYTELFYLRLVDSTKVEEDNEVYITKLSLSMGRSTFICMYCL